MMMIRFARQCALSGAFLALGCGLWAGEELAGETHWAFTALERPAVPEVVDAAWCRDDLDRFVRAAQEAKGITPNAEVDRRRLIRRVTMDLVGLPPTPEEVAAFVNDDAPDAYEKLVDRLLSSPRYGERWGRHWLDVARYGDSMGYRYDDDIPHAWTFRDFVIESFNRDQPFDEFIRWQIAGDEIAPGNPEALAATGFCAVGPRPRIEGNALNKKEARYIEIDDIVATTFQSCLALSMDCARCHDHKFDPISQKEYYSVAKAFLSGERVSRPYLDEGEQLEWKLWREKERAVEADFQQWRQKNTEALEALIKSRRGPMQKEKQEIEERFVEKLKPGERTDDKAVLTRMVQKQGQRLLGKKEWERWKKLREKLGKLEKELLSNGNALREELDGQAYAEWFALSEQREVVNEEKPSGPRMCAAYVDKGAEIAPSYLMERGHVGSPGEEVPLGFLEVLAGHDTQDWQAAGNRESTYQRSTLANWLTDETGGAGGLLARVTANRLWFYHFGTGLVRTPNDFGTQGDVPALPELLDYLAVEMIENGWSLKTMHRRICLSATYRQDTAVDEARLAIDPENRTWWRRRPVRIEAEILRDSILVVSGRLNDRMGGLPVKLPIPKEVILSRLGKAYPDKIVDGPAIWRRSVYAYIKRTVPVPMLQSFDAPDHSHSCGRRIRTTVAPQALILMNDEFVRKRSWDFAARVAEEGGEGTEARVNHAFGLALGRPATEAEQARAAEFLVEQAKRHGGNEPAAWADLCQTLFGLNEFLYID